jgi:hypothetical protein
MESYTFITTSNFTDNKFNKLGTWVVYEGKEAKITLILTELAQSVVGINYGIFLEGKSGRINLYRDGNLVETYTDTISVWVILK